MRSVKSIELTSQRGISVFAMVGEESLDPFSQPRAGCTSGQRSKRAGWYVGSGKPHNCNRQPQSAPKCRDRSCRRRKSWTGCECYGQRGGSRRKARAAGTVEMRSCCSQLRGQTNRHSARSLMLPSSTTPVYHIRSPEGSKGLMAATKRCSPILSAPDDKGQVLGCASCWNTARALPPVAEARSSARAGSESE